NAQGTGTTTISGLSNQFRGIDIVTASVDTATSIQGNTISGIDQTSSRAFAAPTAISNSIFTGIPLASLPADRAFDVGKQEGNTIGSLDGSSGIVVNATSTTAGTFPVLGILDFSQHSGLIANNRIGAISVQGTGTVTGFRGIYADTSSGQTETIDNN